VTATRLPCTLYNVSHVICCSIAQCLLQCINHVFLFQVRFMNIHWKWQLSKGISTGLQLLFNILWAYTGHMFTSVVIFCFIMSIFWLDQIISGNLEWENTWGMAIARSTAVCQNYYGFGA